MWRLLRPFSRSPLLSLTVSWGFPALGSSLGRVPVLLTRARFVESSRSESTPVDARLLGDSSSCSALSCFLFLLLPCKVAAISPSCRRRRSLASGLCFLCSLALACAKLSNRACDSAASLASSASLWFFVSVMMCRRNRVLGLALVSGLIILTCQTDGLSTVRITRRARPTENCGGPLAPSRSTSESSPWLPSLASRPHDRR